MADLSITPIPVEGAKTAESFPTTPSGLPPLQEYRPINTAELLSLTLTIGISAADSTTATDTPKVSLLTITVADLASTAEVPTLSDTLNATAIDPSVTSEQPKVLTGISVAESVATSEYVVVGSLSILVSDSASTTELATAPFPGPVSPVEATQSSEVVAAIPTGVVTEADSAVTTEAVTAVIPLQLAVSETVATSEYPVVVIAITLSEYVQIGFIGPVSASDATTTSESVVAESDIPLSVVDNAATSDSGIALLPFAINVTDTPVTSESLTIQLAAPQVSASETVVCLESQQVSTGTLYVNTLDGTNTSEVTSAPFPGPVSSSDSAIAAESEIVTTAPTYLVTTAESTSTSEFTQEPFPSPIVAAESTATAESVFILPDERAATADSTSSSEFLRLITLDPYSVDIVNDAYTVSEWLVVGFPPVIIFTLEVSTAESVTAAESTNELRVGPPPDLVSETETVTASEAHTVFLPTLVLSKQENSSTIDRVLVGGDLYVGISEVYVAAETANVFTVPSTTYVVQEIESTTLTDAASIPPLILSPNIVEQTVAAEFDRVIPGSFYDVNVIDNVNAGELASAQTETDIFVTTPLDSATLSEQTALMMLSSVTTQETVTNSDSTAASQSVATAVSDTITASETPSVAAPLITAVAELSNTSELVSLFVTPLVPSVLDNANSVENFNVAVLSAYSIYVSEFVNGAEVFAAEQDCYIAITENVATTEQTNLLVSVSVVATDSPVSADVPTVSFNSFITDGEVVGWTDSTTVSPLLPTVNTAETVATAEAVALVIPVAASINEPAQTAENVILTFGAVITEAESSSTSEALNLLLQALIATAETTSAAELIAAILVNLVSASESANTTELVSAQVANACSVADTANTAESIQVQALVSLATSDLAITNETIRLSGALAVHGSDSTVCADQTGLSEAITLSITEATLTAESTLLLPDLQVPISESVITTDIVQVLPDLRIGVVDNALVYTLPIFSPTDFIPITDLVSWIDFATVALSQGLQVNIQGNRELVSTNTYLASNIKSRWGPLLPGDVVPVEEEGDITAIWQAGSQIPVSA